MAGPGSSPTRYGRIVHSTLNPQSKARLCRLFLLGDDLRRAGAPSMSPSPAGEISAAGAAGSDASGAQPYSSVRAALAKADADDAPPICLTFPSSSMPSERARGAAASAAGSASWAERLWPADDELVDDRRSDARSHTSSALGSRQHMTSTRHSATYDDDFDVLASPRGRPARRAPGVRSLPPAVVRFAAPLPVACSLRMRRNWSTIAGNDGRFVGSASQQLRTSFATAGGVVGGSSGRLFR